MSHLDGRNRTLNTQLTETTTRDVTGQDGRMLFVEPEVSGPVDVLEATAFFQVFTVGSDPGLGID